MRRNVRKTKRNKNNGRSRRPAGYSQAGTGSITTRQNPRFGFINPRCLSTFKYNEIISFTVLTLAGGQYVFKMNGMFDPNTTGTGHQPYGFDQMMNIYQRYCVLRTKFVITFSPSNDRINVGYIAASTVTTAVIDAATYNLAAESPHSRTRALSFGGGPPATFRASLATNVLLGTTRAQMMSDDLFQGTQTTDPTNLTVLTIFWYNPSLTTVTASFDLTIEYQAMLFDPYLQNQS
jgi:hypothetical protein